MKYIVRILSVCLLTAGAAQADVAALDLAAGGSNGVGTVVSTAVTDSSGATFDIVYTLGAIANTNNPYVWGNGTQMGVGSDLASDANTTLDGDLGDGISFTSLSIANFVANDSGYVVDDIENLTFSSVTFGSVGHKFDRAKVSFIDWDDTTTAIYLGNNGTITSPWTTDLTGLANYTSPETDLFVQVNNGSGTNRFSIDGIEVTYSIPEPATLGMVAAFGGGILFIRRRFMI